MSNNFMANKCAEMMQDILTLYHRLQTSDRVDSTLFAVAKYMSELKRQWVKRGRAKSADITKIYNEWNRCVRRLGLTPGVLYRRANGCF